MKRLLTKCLVAVLSAAMLIGCVSAFTGCGKSAKYKIGILLYNFTDIQGQEISAYADYLEEDFDVEFVKVSVGQDDDSHIQGLESCLNQGCNAVFSGYNTAIDTCVDMGASITMAKGAADAGQHPSIAVIGDSTFTHSGMTGLLDAVNERANITVIISDNLTTGMTGGQDSAGTGRLEQICAGIGVDPAHIRTVVPLPKNREEMKAVIREEIAHRGVSVIIPRRECIQTAKRHNAAKK